jgi:hypothetical protein
MQAAGRLALPTARSCVTPKRQHLRSRGVGGACGAGDCGGLGIQAQVHLMRRRRPQPEVGLRAGAALPADGGTQVGQGLRRRIERVQGRGGLQTGGGQHTAVGIFTGQHQLPAQPAGQFGPPRRGQLQHRAVAAQAALGEVAKALGQCRRQGAGVPLQRHVAVRSLHPFAHAHHHAAVCGMVQAPALIGLGGRGAGPADAPVIQPDSLRMGRFGGCGGRRGRGRPGAHRAGGVAIGQCQHRRQQGRRTRHGHPRQGRCAQQEAAQQWLDVAGKPRSSVALIHPDSPERCAMVWKENYSANSENPDSKWLCPHPRAFRMLLSL